MDNNHGNILGDKTVELPWKRTSVEEVVSPKRFIKKDIKAHMTVEFVSISDMWLQKKSDIITVFTCC